jgi:hypothetical protein
MAIALVLSAVVPSLLLLWYFYSRDICPEPPRVVALTFALGVATIPLVLAFGAGAEWILERIGAAPTDPYLVGLVDAFVYAALPEEALKLAVLLLYVRRHSAFEEPMDGLVYGVAVSLGFATLENVLYVMSSGFHLALVRALTTLPAHCTLGAIMGFYVARATFEPEHGRSALTLAIVVPMALHTLFDFPLLAIARFDDPASIPDLVGRGLTGLVFGVLGLMVLWDRLLARGQRRRQEGQGAGERGWGPKISEWLPLGFGGLVVSCGGLLIAGGLANPGLPLVIGSALLAGGVALVVHTTRRANQ